MVMYSAWSDRGVLILYVAPWSSSGRSSFSCICSIAGTFSSGCLMENPVIFLSMTFAFTRFLLKLAVVAFFHGFIERSEEHTSELQSRGHLVCRLLLDINK